MSKNIYAKLSFNNLMDDKNKPSAVDLFCGAGGFSNGFENAGINIEYGVDMNDDALETYNHNHNSESLNYDIRDGIQNKILKNEYDIVFGSPPCKGFSDARGSRHVEDERNGLVFEYIQWVSEIQPKIAVMENVTGMRTIGDDFIEGMKKEFEDAGYTKVKIKELNSANFGVPQKRKRVIVIATHKNSRIRPSYPPESKITKNPDNVQTFGENNRTKVKNALMDLPDITNNGIVKQDYTKVNINTTYSEYVRDLESDEKLHNHKAKDISSVNEKARKIVKNLEPGEMYRSTRFGDRYRQIWDILEEQFTEIENECMRFIGKHRSKKEYRIKGKSVGHVDVDMMKNNINYSAEKVEESLEDLLDNGWIRKDEVDDRIGYDLNTKSGVRPRYMRLQPKSQSNTIMTTDFKPREKLHPYKNRGLSLREGARIQSFPDSFEFKGSFQSIASQIGNAVPPLMSYKIGKHIVDKLDN